MSYSNRNSKRAVPGIKPNQQPFSPSAVVEKKLIESEKARKANRAAKR